MSKTKKNLIYNTMYQVLIFIIPLITMPYVSRVLGSNGIGIYSYSYSIVYYFMMFAMVGLNNYGSRAIAKSRDNKELLTINFKEIHFFQILTTSTMIVLLYIFIFLMKGEYKLIFAIQSLHLWSCMFDINWFFFGLEDFKLTVLRNVAFKVISLILIFLFVKKPADVWIYTLILSLSIFLGHISLWPSVGKRIDKSLVFKLNIRHHIVPCLKLFLPVIAISIYKIMDKTMIGLFSTINQVGIYENAEKIVNVPIAIISAFGAVMLPKMSNVYSKNNSNDESKKIIEKSMKFIMFLSTAMAFGLFSISRSFSILFLGKEFSQTGILIQYLSVTIIFLAWGNVIRTQYLIPKEYDKVYIISAFLGAIVNVIFNLLFIPAYGASGACVGTIAAELLVVIYQSLAVRKELPIKTYIINSITFFLKAVLMAAIVYIFNYIQIKLLVRVLLQIGVGVLVYALLNLIYILQILKRKKL